MCVIPVLKTYNDQQTVRYDDPNEEKDRRQLLSWIERAKCGKGQLNVDTFQEPGLDIRSRDLDEDFRNEIAAGFKKMPTFDIQAHTLIRTWHPKFWKSEGTDDVPKCKEDVMAAIKDGSIAKKKWSKEVIAWLHRTSAVKKLKDENPDDPCFWNVNTTYYFSNDREDMELIGRFGDMDNLNSHNVRKDTLADVVSRCRNRCTACKSQQPDLTLTKYRDGNVTHFVRMTKKMKLGTGKTTFMFVLKLANWNKQNFKTLSKFLRPPKLKRGNFKWKGSENLGFYSSVPNQEEGKYAELLRRVMKSTESDGPNYTVKDMQKDLSNHRCNLLISNMISHN